MNCITTPLDVNNDLTTMGPVVLVNRYQRNGKRSI